MYIDVSVQALAIISTTILALAIIKEIWKERKK